MYVFDEPDLKEAFDDFLILLRAHSCEDPMGKQKNQKSADALLGDAGKKVKVES